MKKRICILITAALVGAALWGCGAKGETAAQSGGAPESGQAESMASAKENVEKISFEFDYTGY